MNANQARQLLLVRAHELSQPPSPVWTASDQAWAGDEALRQEGERVSPERWLLRRAALASARLAQRDPGIAVVDHPGAALGWTTATLVLIALTVGLATNAVGPAQRVNLLAPPLLAVMLWNLVVYALLAGHGIAGWRQGPARFDATAPAWWSRAVQWTRLRRLTGPISPSLQRFASDWARVSQRMQTARVVTALHLAAAALAAGALAGLYLRGLVLEFRAGWDSTFLTAEAVHAWLAWLLAPAAWLSGIALPDAAHLETLRFSHGPGENAARWIHLYAITTAAIVLLPRGLLAARAAWRASTLQHHLPVPLDDAYVQRLFQQLAQARGGPAQRVDVLPYSYQLEADRRPALAAALNAELGPGLQMHIRPSVPLGGEDMLDRHWLDPRHDGVTHTMALLFASAATPERETHGAFVQAVRGLCAALPLPPRLLAVVDESGFRQRLASADLGARVAQRRAAWQALLGENGLHPLFVDLGIGAASANA